MIRWQCEAAGIRKSGRGEIEERVRDAIVAVGAEDNEAAAFYLRAESAALVHRDAGCLAEDELLVNCEFWLLLAEGRF